jgi:hypothetical protein
LVIANCSFKNLDELEEVLFGRCQVLLKQLSIIKAIALVGARIIAFFHWWPKTKAL